MALLLILIFQAVAEDIFKDPLELDPVQAHDSLIDSRHKTDCQSLRFVERRLFPDVIGNVGLDIDGFPVEGNLPQIEL